MTTGSTLSTETRHIINVLRNDGLDPLSTAELELVADEAEQLAKANLQLSTAILEITLALIEAGYKDRVSGPNASPRAVAEAVKLALAERTVTAAKEG